VERIATLEPGEMAPPLKSLFVYFFLIIMVGAIYLALRFKVFVGLPLEWDLYMDEIIFFLIPLGLVMLFFRLDVWGTLQLRRVAWSSLPLFGAAGCVLVAFQVFILALASRFVPEIVRYIDLNSYLGYETFTKTILALPVAGQIWVVCIAPALVEELLFRGYVQSTLVGRLGARRGIWITGALFALVHLGILRIPFDLLVSYIMGYIVIRYRSVWPAVVFHFANNLVNLLVLNLIPGFDTERLSAVSLALMAAAVAYMGWQIMRFLHRASAELKAEAVLAP